MSTLVDEYPKVNWNLYMQIRDCLSCMRCNLGCLVLPHAVRFFYFYFLFLVGCSLRGAISFLATIIFAFVCHLTFCMQFYSVDVNSMKNVQSIYLLKTTANNQPNQNRNSNENNVCFRSGVELSFFSPHLFSFVCLSFRESYICPFFDHIFRETCARFMACVFGISVVPPP